MNFMEAVEQMKLGKKVRRKSWKQGRIIHREGYDLSSNIKTNDKDIIYDNLYVSIDDIEATDWEVVDDDSDWNLAEQKYHPSNEFIVDDLIKCRDLILEDIGNIYNDYQFRNFQKFIEAINKRFGDLK